MACASNALETVYLPRCRLSVVGRLPFPQGKRGEALIEGQIKLIIHGFRQAAESHSMLAVSRLGSLGGLHRGHLPAPQVGAVGWPS